MSDNQADWPWSELGLPGQPEDAREIRRAYARRLKTIDQTSDIEGFEALRNAYELALHIAGGETRERRVTPAAIKPNIPSGHIHSRLSEILQPPQPVLSQDEGLDDPTEQDAPRPEAPSPQTSFPDISFPDTPAAEDVPDFAEAEHREAGIKPDSYHPWTRNDDPDTGTLFDQMDVLIQNNKMDAEPWQKLFLADALSDPQISEQFETALLEFLESKISDSYHCRGLYIAAEDRFGWVSDGVDFLRRYPDKREIFSLMSKAVAKRRAQQERHMRAEDLAANEVVEGKNLPFIFWLVPILLSALIHHVWIS